MRVEIFLVDEGKKKWGWKVKAGAVQGGGKRTAKSEKQAEKQAKDFVTMLVKTEKVNLATDSVVMATATRRKSNGGKS